ncbi:MAG: ABC transporter permease [Treponema sp.]|nr:ABC transporter permease [Treponema sp.]
MTVRSCFLYAVRIVFSKNRTNGRKSLFASMVCIGISLVPLLAVMSISDGMIDGITGRIIGLSTQDVDIFFPSDSEEVSSLEAFFAAGAEASRMDHVTQVYPEVQGTALASSLSGGNYRSGACVRAVPDDIFVRNESFKSLFKLIEGQASFPDGKSVILCQKMAEDLNVGVGGRISLVTARLLDSGMLVPKTAVFTVSGILSCGYQELDALWAFIPIQTGFSFLPRNAASYSVRLKTDGTFTSVVQRVKHDARLLFPLCPVWTWSEMNSSQFENFSSTRILLLLVMVLIVLVASVNISSALVMVTMERLKEIAILKSVGASPRGIQLSFLLVGGICGLGGLSVGLPLGVLAAVNMNPLLNLLERLTNVVGFAIHALSHPGGASGYVGIRLLDPAYYLQDIPVTIGVSQVLGVALMTMLLSLLASLIPAAKAGREKPLDTLRKV